VTLLLHSVLRPCRGCILLFAPMDERRQALSPMAVGPVLEAVLQACHLSSFAALRGASSHSHCLADRSRRVKFPKWPLKLTIGCDEFVQRHRNISPEFAVHFDIQSCRAFAGEEEMSLPQQIVEVLISQLGSMHRAFGDICKLWALPKLRRRATMRYEMTKEEYEWSSMQVAMQCDPRASRQLLLVDADQEVFLRHTFLDHEYLLPGPGMATTGAFRKLDGKGLPCDEPHRWVLCRLREVLEKQRGRPTPVDDCLNNLWLPGNIFAPSSSLRPASNESPSDDEEMVFRPRKEKSIPGPSWPLAVQRIFS